MEPTFPRKRWILVALATAVGAGFRLYGLSNVGLAHFDEGIYALSGLWPYTGQFAPNQALFSPPVYPFLVGISYLIAGGPSDTAAIAVSAFFGIATIPLAYFVAVNWWNEQAGIVAAWLVAVDGYAIAFSRIALTDPTFTFFFLLATYLVIRAVEGPPAASIRSLLLAGVCVGFTWNIKYNGFLPLLIALPWLVAPDRRRRSLRLGMIAIVAFLCYLPWLLHVESTHGYAELVKHHRGYWLGPSAIRASLFDWWMAHASLSWWASGAAMLGASLAMRCWRVFPLPLATVISAHTPFAPYVWLVFLTMGGVLLATKWRWRAAWMLAVLAILPACYSFYARLWLPSEVFGILAVAIGFVAFVEVFNGRHALFVAYHVLGAITFCVSILMVFVLFATQEEERTVQPRPVAEDGYRLATANLLTAINPQTKRVLLLARPPLRFYLSLHATKAEFVTLDGSGFGIEWIGPNDLLVVDQAEADSPGFAGDLADAVSRGEIERVDAFAIHPSLAASLDDTLAKGGDEKREALLRVYKRSK